MDQPDGTGGTPKKTWQELFLGKLRTSGNVSLACKAARVGRTTAYRQREDDQQFAAAWATALEDAADALEAVAWKRASTGQSDTLLIFLLKGLKPEKFRERSEVNVNVRDLDAAIENELARLATLSQAEVPGEAAGDETE